MGRYWVLINLDKRQAFGHWGKLGEFIGDRSSSLIPYLVVPASAVPTSSPNANLISSWAGDRIICIGDYIRKMDYPKGLLTEDEILEIQSEKNLFNIVYHKYETVPRFRLPATESVAFAHDRVWVLRNLSKRQYFRADALGAGPQYVVGPETRRGGPNIGDALLPWILWSSEGGLHNYYGEIGRGSWAGDRFDIQTLDTVENNEEWTDVSEKFADEIARNRSLYFGCALGHYQRS